MSFDLQRFAEFPNTLEKDGDNYLIKTVADLQVLSTCVNAGNNCEGLTFKLANDIDMNGVDFVPIGYVDYRNMKIEIYPFSGTFDGNRHTISNLTINKPDKNYVGLFGLISGAVKNVILANANITGNAWVGGVVGSNGWGTVYNCKASVAIIINKK